MQENPQMQEMNLDTSRTPVYFWGRKLCWAYMKLFCGAKMEGIENFPKDQNFIVLGNHISAMDPLLLAAAYKTAEIHFMAKDSLFRHQPLKWICTQLHGIPVRRGETDMAAMRQSLQVLKDKKVLGIFPEGTRHKDGKMGEIQSGIGLIALRNTCPLIPIGISGHYRPFGKLTLRVGKPVDISDLRAGRPDTAAMTEVARRIREAIEALR